MGRLIRRRGKEAGRRGLTKGQRLLLVAGVTLGEEGFTSPGEYEAAWWRYRDELLFALGSWRRPEAYWWVERCTPPPDCPAGGNESEHDALIRLGLPLSDEERSLLQRERMNRG